MPQKPEPKIKAEGIVKIFGKEPQKALEYLNSGYSREEVLQKTDCVIGVNQVSFEVDEAETFVVMGLSGSGKSTLIRCINRLIMPTQGSIALDGEDIVTASTQRLRDLRQQKLGMVFQHFALLPHKTVRDNVAYGLHVMGLSKEERYARAEKAIDEVGLTGWADVKPSNLSGGMKQRVGIARALAIDSEILLMDEPFGALDPLIRRDMQDMMIDLQRKLRKTIIFITHDLLEALKLGDRIAIMKEGRFVQIGTPEDIVSKPKDPYVADFVKDVDRARVLKAWTLHKDQPTLTPDMTAGQAREVIDGLSATGAYVTDADNKPIGVVEKRTVHDSGANMAAPVAEVMKTDIDPVDCNALLVDLFAHCRDDRPIVLADPDGTMRGIVKPFELFQRLAELEESDPELAA